jgi:benzaldehyde dehydrogenase (NAD)
MALLDTGVWQGKIWTGDRVVDPVAPFDGIGASGTGARHGSPQANLEAFTETQWITVRGALPTYPY